MLLTFELPVRHVVKSGQDSLAGKDKPQGVEGLRKRKFDQNCVKKVCLDFPNTIYDSFFFLKGDRGAYFQFNSKSSD